MTVKPTVVLLSDQVEVRVDSLAPDDLKSRLKSARKKRNARCRDRTTISLGHHQNELVGALGFPPHFGAYKETGYPKLQTFLRERGLRRRADLITPRRSGKAGQEGWYGGSVALRRQEVSERLFLSGLDRPRRLFTGYDFDFWNCWESGAWVLDRLLWSTCPNLVSVPIRPCIDGSPDAAEANVELAMRRGQEEMDTGHVDHPQRQVVDVILGGYMDAFHGYFDMLGDMRFEQRDGRGDGVIHHDLDDGDRGPVFRDFLQPYVRLFRHRIASEDCGWVEIVDVNDSLIVLCGSGGEFDWLVRNQRDEVFDTRVYGEKLAARHAPLSSPDYHFEHWLHFEHVGWKQMDLDRARRARPTLPAEGGGHFLVPATDRELLMQHYASTGEFAPPAVRSATPKPGFAAVDVGPYRLAVSELVTIDELLGWAAKLGPDELPGDDDRLGPVNGEGDRSLPAATTRHALLRYIRHVEDRLGIPCRLMSEAEYRAMRRGRIGDTESCSNEPLLEFVTPDGAVIDGHPPYMPEDDFQALHHRYRHAPDRIALGGGLHAVDSDEIAEWLREGTCIASRSLHCPCGGADIPLRHFAPGSTGKYKGLKCVFRLCHELDPES